MSKKVLIIGLAVLIAVCGVSTYFHIKNRVESEDNRKMYETVAEEVSATEEGTAPTATEKPVNPYANTVSGEHGGAGINYPIMQTPSIPDYYLNHDFYKNESVYVFPYVQAICDANTPSDNVIIYAHHMNDGSMFAGLKNFRSKDYWSSHKTISFNTLNKNDNFDILAVFSIPVDESDKNSFKFYEFVNAYDPDHFSTFVAKII